MPSNPSFTGLNRYNGLSDGFTRVGVDGRVKGLKSAAGVEGLGHKLSLPQGQRFGGSVFRLRVCLEHLKGQGVAPWDTRTALKPGTFTPGNVWLRLFRIIPITEFRTRNQGEISSGWRPYLNLLY